MTMRGTTFSDLAGEAPLRIWDGVRARAVHGDRITLSVVGPTPAASSPSTDTTGARSGRATGQLFAEAERRFGFGSSRPRGSPGRSFPP
jgi:hypothetical protein